MIKKLAVTLFLLSTFFISCNKKPVPPQNQVTLESSVEALFSKAIDQIQTQGHSIDELDKANHTAKSDWKQIEANELANLATLKQANERYQSGRIAYKISVKGDESQATLTVDALIEGLYIPTQKESQGNEKFGTNKSYEPVSSNGAAEKTFIATIQQ